MWLEAQADPSSGGSQTLQPHSSMCTAKTAQERERERERDERASMASPQNQQGGLQLQIATVLCIQSQFLNSDIVLARAKCPINSNICIFLRRLTSCSTVNLMIPHATSGSQNLWLQAQPEAAPAALAAAQQSALIATRWPCQIANHRVSQILPNAFYRFPNTSIELVKSQVTFDFTYCNCTLFSTSPPVMVLSIGCAWV